MIIIMITITIIMIIVIIITIMIIIIIIIIIITTITIIIIIIIIIIITIIIIKKEVSSFPVLYFMKYVWFFLRLKFYSKRIFSLQVLCKEGWGLTDRVDQGCEFWYKNFDISVLTEKFPIPRRYGFLQFLIFRSASTRFLIKCLYINKKMCKD